MNQTDSYQTQLARTTQALVELHRRIEGPGCGPVDFRSWIPRSERKQRQRLFVQSSIGGEPKYVAKVPLDPADAMPDHEWKMLCGLNGIGVVRPRPIRHLGTGFVMSYVPWRDFPDVMAATEAQSWPALLCSAVDVAACLHTSGRAAAAMAPVTVAATYLPAGMAIPQATMDWLERAAVAPAHGDLGPWNLRVDRHGTVALIDWEDYHGTGSPALDVLNLVITAALIAFPDYRERGFAWLYDRVFHGRNAFRAAATAALRRYCALTGQDADGIVGLTPLFCRWMIRRIQDQGRPVSHLFFLPFAEYFEAETPRWEWDDCD